MSKGVSGAACVAWGRKATWLPDGSLSQLAVPGRRGNDYQTLVLLQNALLNYFNNKPFTLKTEVDDGTDLDDLELCVDDIVFKYQIKNGTHRGCYYTPAI